MKPLKNITRTIKNFTATIKGKIIAITTGTITVIALIMVSVCFVVFQSLLRQNQIQSVEFGLQLVSSNVAFDMKDITYFARWCGSSNDILKYLNTFQDKPPLAVASRSDKSLRSIALNSAERLKEEFHNTSRYITRVIVSTNSASNFLQVVSTSGDTLSYNIDDLVEQQRQVYLLLIGAIAIAILSLGFFMAMSLNRTINQPVAKIQKKIHAIAQGDFSRDESIEWNHELGDIGKGVNTLAFDVVNLMNRRIEDEKQKKDLQYQILQSQINPHFLYNTLNSIKWMATIQGSPGIAEMTTALARLLRQVAKGSCAMITLEEELNLVKDYFLIQQYRYGGGIAIDYRIQSQDLYQCMVHRFSLQPIVENALFHGIEPKGSTGKIVIKAWICPDGDPVSQKTELHISITDNGVGMSQETIEKVLHQKPSKKSADFFRQVGIANVDQRIRHEFGEKYGISIESQVGVYTTMTITTPCIFLTKPERNQTQP